MQNLFTTYSDFPKLSFLNSLDKYWQMRKAIFFNNDMVQYLLDYPSIRFMYVNQGYQAIYGHLPSVIFVSINYLYTEILAFWLKHIKIL